MSFFRNFPTQTYDFYGNGVNRNIVDLFRFVRPVEEFIDELSIYSYYQIEDGDRADVVSQKLYNTPEYYWTFFVINEHLREGPSHWPLSYEQFERFMSEEFDGTVITCIPDYEYDSDGLLLGVENSLADRFQIGEPIVGFLSGATGVVHSKDVNKQQLVITNISGVFQENEIIRGQITEDFITSYQAIPWALAPHHYEDADGREVDNSIFVEGGYPHTMSKIVTNYEYQQNLNEQYSKIRVVNPDRIFEFTDRYYELITK
jgi:hypothetical protein